MPTAKSCGTYRRIECAKSITEELSLLPSYSFGNGRFFLSGRYLMLNFRYVFNRMK